MAFRSLVLGCVLWTAACSSSSSSDAGLTLGDASSSASDARTGRVDSSIRDAVSGGSDGAPIPSEASDAVGSALPDATGTHDATAADAGPGEFLGAVTTSGEFGAHELAIDSTSIYVAATNGILAFPIAGGPPTTVASGSGVGDIAVDATYIYYFNRYSPQSVMRLPKSGGTPTTLAPSTFATPIVAPTHLQVDSTNLYFVDGMGSGVFAVPLAGGSIGRLSGLYGNDLAVLGGYLYVGTVSAVSALTTTGAPLGSASTSGFLVAADATNVYWVEDPLVRSVAAATLDAPTADAGTIPTLATGVLVPSGVLLSDGQNLYLANPGDEQPGSPGSVLRIPTAGGGATTIATGVGGPYGLVADATYIYYTFEAGLYRQAK